MKLCNKCEKKEGVYLVFVYSEDSQVRRIFSLCLSCKDTVARILEKKGIRYEVKRIEDRNEVLFLWKRD